ncbi:MAG: hypothetical protein K8L99_07365 [Anaerolineae bacterium]|nr:hypothetical protein [Anaerolineae bacterium]
MEKQFNDFYASHLDLTRHWCPLSQPYAGVDALLSFLNGGWTMEDAIACDEHWLGGNRRILVYYFVLTNQEDVVTMPVLCNPVLDRLLTQLCQRDTSVVGMEQEVSIETGKRFHEHGKPCLSDAWSLS